MCLISKRVCPPRGADGSVRSLKVVTEPLWHVPGLLGLFWLPGRVLQCRTKVTDEEWCVEGEVSAGWRTSDCRGNSPAQSRLITHSPGPTSIRRRWSHFLQHECSDFWSRKLHLTFQFSFPCQFPSLMTLCFLKNPVIPNWIFLSASESLNMLCWSCWAVTVLTSLTLTCCLLHADASRWEK